MKELYIQAMEDMIMERTEKYVSEGMDENEAEEKAEQELYHSDAEWEAVNDRVIDMISSAGDAAHDSLKDSRM